jgi:hypothetical protein
MGISMHNQVCSILTDETPLVLPLHPAEERLLRLLRALGHGSCEVKVVAGLPVLLEQVTQQIKLI